MNYSVAIAEKDNEVFCRHLIRADGDEDLCFALYNPSQGTSRFSGLIFEIILPIQGDRNLHGNVSFNAVYYDRVTSLALQKGCGICFLHSHPSKGWQGMSRPDIAAEEMLAPRVQGITGLPLLGMTIGNDKNWSARFWLKQSPGKYKRVWCESVRIAGKGLKVWYYDKLLPPPGFGIEFTRTVSAWGDAKQADIARLKVGIIGLGSVGSIIAESLMKTGVQHIMMIDFDVVERKNLDRLQGIGKKFIGTLKVVAMKQILEEQKLTEGFFSQPIPYSIIEEQGYRNALDCDVLFSCVDRPWPRYVLNNLSYLNLIPVVDGGIETNAKVDLSNIDQARWRAHTIGPGRRCLNCLGQYRSEDVALEQSGLLEDPHYIKDQPKDHFINRGENVYAFSLGLAAMEMQQFLSLVLQPRKMYYGPKEFDFNTGNIDQDFPFLCEENCGFPARKAVGDKMNKQMISDHPIAIKMRERHLERPKEAVLIKRLKKSFQLFRNGIRIKFIRGFQYGQNNKSINK